MLNRFDSLPRETRDTLFLLAVIAWIVVPQVPHIPVWCTMLGAGVLLWRGWLAVASKPLPGKGWLLALLAVAVAATFATHRTVLGRDAGVTMIVVLLALKTLELRAKRDIFVVFFLGFFTMLTNFFFSQSLATAGAMLLALLGLLTALVNAHMPVGKPPLSEAARTAGWMTLLGAPVMAVLFVLFPRFAPLWGTPGDAMAGRSGLSSTMQVGNIASLALDESIAMRVKFEGSLPAQQDMYFRGPVLSTFDGREWRPLQQRFATLAFTGISQLQVLGPPVHYEVTLEPTNRPWLMVLDAAQQAPQSPGMDTVMTSELVWLANRAVTDLLRYKAESHTQFRHGPRTIAALAPEYLALPPDFNPRTQQLASQMRAEGAVVRGGTPAFVQAALDRLRGGGYRYTLDPGVYGADTADEFWFDRKEGFCEHIASAFVVLMRSAGIPARVVTGYQGGELNRVDGYWVVRQSDAHAWTEVWFAGQGWVRVDPTSAVAPGRIGSLQRLAPPQGALAAAFGSVTPGLALNLRAAWEAINNAWNQRILNYTQSRQLNLLKDIGFLAPSWEDLAFVLIAIVVLVAIGGAAWTVWDRREHDPWLRLLHRVRRRLASNGMNLTPAAPPRRIAMLVTAQFGQAGAQLADWLLKLEQQRYAPSASADLRALRRELRTIAWPA
ncbi:transglutaminase family protein [Ramlibacter sp. PS4R-6]|uniref:transglutaminase family protein n=1 Tax=Ramlibacter sp. PS4R-6 TaxID=3133438 RepID=UPI0030B3D3A7